MADELRAMIDDELAAFVRGPVWAILSSVDDRGTPDAISVLGLMALDERRLRIVIAEHATVARHNADVGARVAVLVQDIVDHRSIQWKGRVIESGATPTPGDIALVDHRRNEFAESCRLVGLDPSTPAQRFPADSLALVIDVDEIVDERQWPDSGRSLVAGD